jgi:hypothetical protein
VATLPPASGPGAAQGITSVAAAGTISVASTIGVSFVVSPFSALPQATHIATIAITINHLFIFYSIFFINDANILIYFEKNKFLLQFYIPLITKCF